jgi:hypothetical protein
VLGAHASIIGLAAASARAARRASHERSTFSEASLDTTMILAGVDNVKKNDHRAIASELPGEFGARN